MPQFSGNPDAFATWSEAQQDIVRNVNVPEDQETINQETTVQQEGAGMVQFPTVGAQVSAGQNTPQAGPDSPETSTFGLQDTRQGKPQYSGAILAAIVLLGVVYLRRGRRF